MYECHQRLEKIARKERIVLYTASRVPAARQATLVKRPEALKELPMPSLTDGIYRGCLTIFTDAVSDGRELLRSSQSVSRQPLWSLDVVAGALSVLMILR